MKKQITLVVTILLVLSISVLAQTEQNNTEFWQQQRGKALEKRNQPIGERPPGLIVPKDLTDVYKREGQQLQRMVDGGYVQPLDYPDLAEKRTKGELVELPLATESYIVEVGGNTDESEFSTFSFRDGSQPLKADATKFSVLKTLADDFDGEKYDLENPKHRRQMKIRLLRMINPQAKEIIEKLAAAYQMKFNRPLRITSLIRSIEYQKNQNEVDSNSFLVRNEKATPPHASGLAFDIGRKHLTAEEQNFVMKQLSQMETNGKIDASIEYGVNAVFHVFVIEDSNLKPLK